MRILWTQKARSDLIDIFDYILQDNPQAAVDVLDRIEQSAEKLLGHPGIGRPGRVEHTRELVIGGLPYILPYLTGTNTITIVRVLHAAMKWPDTFEDS